MSRERIERIASDLGDCVEGWDADARLLGNVTAREVRDLCQWIKEREAGTSHLPWWRKDRLGWPIETFKGRPVLSAIRIICQNIRKVTG